jgi:bisphosphoglycerate-dependent phosphoglycerate mutase
MTKEGFEEVGYVLHERAYQRAEQIYDQKMKGRHMKDFVGDEPYTEEAMKRIEDRVVQIEVEFAEQVERLPEDLRQKHEMSKKLADCLEGVILNVKTWFGPTSKVYPTTRFDDYVNGVDLVAERMNGDIANHHGFALDITYAGYNTILKKLNRIADKLKKGKMGKVDFFKTNDGKFKGQLNGIPLVVIGADGNTMRGLVNMFAEGSDEEIEDHPVQFQIVDQVLMQCDFFINFAETIEKKEVKDRVIEAYRILRRDFELIKKLKERLATTGLDDGTRDSFHGNLQAALSSMKGE